MELITLPIAFFLRGYKSPSFWNCYSPAAAPGYSARLFQPLTDGNKKMAKRINTEILGYSRLDSGYFQYPSTFRGVIRRCRSVPGKSQGPIGYTVR